MFSLAGTMIQAELQEPEGPGSDSDEDKDKDEEEEAPILLHNAAVSLAQELQPSWLSLIHVSKKHHHLLIYYHSPPFS